MGQKITAPAPIQLSDSLDGFDCGVVSMNDWLSKRALRNENSGASRTYVITDTSAVIGYYCLSTGSVTHVQVPANIKRNMPDPIPVMILGRLAIDLQWQGQGLAKGLLKDALLRCYAVSQEVGVKAVLVHALSKSARYFYRAHGFKVSPIDEMTLVLPIKHIAAQL